MQRIKEEAQGSDRQTLRDAPGRDRPGAQSRDPGMEQLSHRHPSGARAAAEAEPFCVGADANLSEAEV